ncbi:MAG: nucleotidyl transferase AbiEii/AbiGii toxin family protein [Sphaerochaeta sp.]|nr:nucleotidyl transferase AbiEii/AbiGii toxin family protein [Sphaerochaeta sp.]
MAARATELNFIRDTLEKVFRLTEILSYINENPIMKNCLALKGGTAINLTVFDLPRLSVDIDLDYCATENRIEMLAMRQTISEDLDLYIMSEGYILGPQTRKKHSLDSFVLLYQNLGGVRDNIKIEINYSLRSHIFNPELRKIKSSVSALEQYVLSLNSVEIFAAKINALLSRSAARDLYDTYNMITTNLFNQEQLQMLRKCTVFYTAVSQEQILETYDLSRIDTITFRKIQTDLLPVIQKSLYVDTDHMRRIVKEFLVKLLQLTDNEKKFLSLFKSKIFKPELVFDDPEIITNISSHPMVAWKMMNHDKD